ncbi:hypothetical protein [Paenibacillus polymyxa]|uniref:hypothetical protein n=1 Tax=Paenibacillus polymyxa TaxID=1406 RepID=UPI00021BBB9F|nr:hypothetical protein [Paenibacillus polymyxa]MDN4106208.1 hypothetical protein [Paenibacillus polymyxa]CCC86329.1 hypothetical protein PPM_p0179 [Paenibacillus polymyxa M1]
MPNINDLIAENNWSMLSWRERYGDGIWLALAPSITLLDNIEFISTGGDIQSIELSSYFHDQGLWLPVVKADTINSALSKLDLKIFSIPKEFVDKWMDAVHEAYERVYELGRTNNYMLNSAIEQKDSGLMPPKELQEYMLNTPTT